MKSRGVRADCSRRSAFELVEAFVGARITGEERHLRRLAKTKAIEAKYSRGS